MPTHELWSGQVTVFSTSVSEKDFVQARELWNIICKEPNGEKEFLQNIIPTIQELPDKLKIGVIGKLLITIYDTYYLLY
jgi:catalase